MEITNLPNKYNELWSKCLPLLQKGRPGDDTHAVEVTEFILSLKDQKFDLDILIPVAIMHDIGHSAILAEHFKYITGQERVLNGKLVHMLVGAKIAKDILDSLNYNQQKINEITEIISMHDADQLENTNVQKIYDTENKKVFHDVDCMDRYNAERLKKMSKTMPDKDKMFKMLKMGLDNFFFPEFKEIAEKRYIEIINQKI